MQIAASIGWGADNLIIAQVLGQDAVAEYAATRRLFTIIPLLVGTVLAPLWPAYGEAIARADVAWVRKMLTRSVVLTFTVSGLVCTGLVMFGKQIMAVWVRGALTPSWLLLVALGIMTVFGQTGGALSTFLNGASAMRLQAVTGVLMAIANLPISIYLTYRIGVSGVVWGTVAAGAIFSWLPSLFYVPLVLKRIQRDSGQGPKPQSTGHEHSS
jgi:O-antigen/teichoic acid export membrane protein